MNTFAQLDADFYIITFGLLFIFGWILAIAAIWLLLRASRDIHQVSKALWAIHHTMQHQAQPTEIPLPHKVTPHSGIAMSQFGR